MYFIPLRKYSPEGNIEYGTSGKKSRKLLYKNKESGGKTGYHTFSRIGQK